MAESSTHLYFIGAEGLDFIKVGRSKNPTRRLRQLRTASPYKLRLLSTYDGEGGLEPYVLAMLRERLTTNGEWFLASDLDVEVLVAEAREVRTAVPPDAVAVPEEASGDAGRGFGASIVKHRRLLGMKQKDLREISGLSQRYLSAVEHDKVDPRLSIAQRIATALGVPLCTLVSGVAHD
jgi:DNA-binding XRE family transcriptional regulator